MQARSNGPAAAATPGWRGPWRRRWAIPVAALLVCLGGLPGTATSAAPAPPPWVTTWSVGNHSAEAFGEDPFALATAPLRELIDQSVRMVVRTSVGGRRLRIRLTNRFGTRPVTFGHVFVGRQLAGASIVSGTNRPVRFGGRDRVTIAAGAEVASDPVSLPVPGLADLIVSMHVKGNSGLLSWHRFANTTSYLTPPGSGDHAADPTGAAFTWPTTSWVFVQGVDVDGVRGAGTIVALGDSITDGFPLAPDQHDTWPAVLSNRLQTRPGSSRRAVVNAGIAGNTIVRVNCGQCGEGAVYRMDRDVLAVPGVTHMILFEGTNDLGCNRTPDGIVNGMKIVIAKAHQRGIRVIGATITPRADVYWGPVQEQGRQIVNRWIRTAKAFDAVLDFDAVVRNPLDPSQLNPAYDSGDHLHPNSLGLRALGNAVDLGLFDRLTPLR